MALQVKHIPVNGNDLDSDELRITPDRVPYMKNLTFSVNRNPGSVTTEGQNRGVATPYEGNLLLDDANFNFPLGKNYVIGYHEAKETNEGYVFVWNSYNNHFIYRVNGSDGTIQMVYQSPCLNFQLDPKHFINGLGRVSMQVVQKTDVVTGRLRDYKFLVWTDNHNPQRFLAVEDSIATNSFNSDQFPYFQKGFCEPCDGLISLGVPTPLRCINIAGAERLESDAKKQNLLNNKTWQWRLRTIDVWGRVSEHGIISDQYQTIIGGACISTSSGLARCVKLTFDAGCSIIDKIQVEFRTCSGNNRNTTTPSDWFQYEVVNKYNDCEGKQWWERTIANPYQVAVDKYTAEGKTPEEIKELTAGLLRYNEQDHTFTYTFCGDKECQPIAVEETSRNENALPLKSGSVFSLNNGIGLADNTRGFDPMDCKEIDKIEYGIQEPPSQFCETKLYKLTIYGMIWNAFLERISVVRQSGDDVVFGEADCPKNKAQAFDQTFPRGQYPGWIGYLAGTRYNAFSKQYSYNPADGSETFIGYSNIGNFNIPVQKWEFEVPPGRYVFRVASHRVRLEADYQRTSTYVRGRTFLDNCGLEFGSLEKEIVVDVVNGDVIVKENPIMIYDLTCDGRKNPPPFDDRCKFGDATTVVDGYLYEDKVNRFPIELSLYDVQSVGGGFLAGNSSHHGVRTDHNGFFFGACITKMKLKFEIIDYCTGSKSLESSQTVDNFNSGGHIKHDELYVFADGVTEFPAVARRLIKGRITICDRPDIGVAGQAVVLSRGQWTLTDSNGEFTIIAHNRSGGALSYDEFSVLTQRGPCRLFECNSCNPIFPNKQSYYIPCGAQSRTTTLTSWIVNIDGVNKYGLISGGRYGVGIIGHDGQGRCSFIEASDHHYVDVPAMIDLKRFDGCKITFNLNGATFASWMKYISFAVTKNLNFDDFATWQVDYVQFVDATGGTNTVAPTQIRIYYQSMAEYAEFNNLATNTSWQFFATMDGEQQNYLGDIVEFIQNGDGEWFDKTITSLIRYDKAGKFFVIDYTQDLKDLKQGALIRFIRPKQCLTNNLYYEVCSTIRVINGQAQVQSGVLNYYDAYFQARQIPTPTIEDETSELTNSTTDPNDGNNGAGTDDPNDNDPFNTTTTNTIRTFPFLFEHHSPSDFWGDHCAPRGRVYVKNPYARQQLYQSEIALSGAINSNSYFNFLSYFSDSDRTQFDEQEWGRITAVLPEMNTLLVLCEHNNFVVGFGDNNVKVDANNNVIGGGLVGKFSAPHRKIGSDYGCQMEDLCTIAKKDGLVLFLDRYNSALLLHNYSDAADTSIDLGFNSWLTAKVATIQSLNDESIHYFHGGIDPKTSEYFLTSFAIPRNDMGALESYVNHERDVSLLKNETLVLDVDFRRPMFKGWVSFTPEFYGALKGYVNDKNFLSFQFGKPWSHHNRGQNVPFNNFFGEQCKKVIRTVTSLGAEKEKKYLWTEVYCREHVWVIDAIRTESGQASLLPLAWWEKRETFYCAAYLCATNTPFDPNIPLQTGINALLDGDMLSGRWLSGRYVSLDEDDGKYCEVSAICVYVIGSEKSDQ